MTAELHPYLRDTIEAANATTVPPDWRLMVGKTSSVYLGPRLSDTNGVWLRICYPFGDQQMWRVLVGQLPLGSPLAERAPASHFGGDVVSCGLVAGCDV